MSYTEERCLDCAMLTYGKCQKCQKDEHRIALAPVGWLCPKCGRGNSPYTDTCPCGPQYWTWADGTTDRYRWNPIND